MAQINKPTDYFNTKLYVGDGTTSNAITGVGFQPDWVWTKNRTNARGHGLFDSVRGADKWLQSDNNLAEQLQGQGYGVLSFDTDGFTVGNGTGTNESGSNMVAWNWLASNTTASNTDGSITSTVSANTTSGFSIVSYTGTGANNTVGHGLSSAPKMIIIKDRTGTGYWMVYHVGIGSGANIVLNTTGGSSASSLWWQNTAPTSSVFSIGVNTNNNNNGSDYIAYCFAEKKGFSKFGSYTGNGSADGTFVYTGFKPMWVLFKRTDSANGWYLYDSVRDPENQNTKALIPSEADAEQNESGIDLLSNSFKLRNADGSKNASGGSYIYMAFAESPLVGTNNTPATAR